MNKSIVTVIVFITFCFLFSFKENPSSSKFQENEIPQNVQLAVSATKMNILYIGLDNPLDIAISNENSELMTVKTDNGTIEKKSNSLWIARVVRTGLTTIKVYINKNGKNFLYGERKFRTFRVPAPELDIKGSNGISISREKLINNPKLNIVLKNFTFDSEPYSVSSFTVRIEDKSSTKEIKCIGNTLNREALDLVKASSNESILSFNDIKITSPDMSTGTIQPVTLILK